MDIFGIPAKTLFFTNSIERVGIKLTLVVDRVNFKVPYLIASCPIV